jgi:predicted nucleic acid-binding protein
MTDYLVDTNILLRLADRADPRHATVRTALWTLKARGDAYYATGQNFQEFWRVATRPRANNGMGLSPVAAERELRLVERVFSRLPEADETYTHWRRLVIAAGVSGIQVHDTRLVAVMLVHSVTHILTFKGSDFVRFAGTAGITIVDPADV